MSTVKLINRKHIPHGFTLIELLIVMSVFIIINLVVVSLFSLGVDGKELRTKSFTQIGQQRTCLALMAKDIRQADAIEQQFQGFKSSSERLILKQADGSRIVYEKDSVQLNSVRRIQISAKGQSMPMTVLKDLDSLQFKVENNIVVIELGTLEQRDMDTHLRRNQMAVRIRKES